MLLGIGLLGVGVDATSSGSIAYGLEVILYSLSGDRNDRITVRVDGDYYVFTEDGKTSSILKSKADGLANGEYFKLIPTGGLFGEIVGMERKKEEDPIEFQFIIMNDSLDKLTYLITNYKKMTNLILMVFLLNNS